MKEQIKDNIYDENILEVAKFMIQLYIKTGGKYNLTARKLDNLLVIYKMCCLNNGLNCFKNEKYTQDNSSYKFPIISKSFFSTICKGNIEQDNMFINDIINNSIICSEMYLNRTILSLQSKRLSIEIFKKFGNYNEKELNILLLEILINFKKLDIKSINNFFNNIEYFEEYSNNEVFKFIYDKEFGEELYIDIIIKKFNKLSVESQKKILEDLSEIYQNNRIRELIKRKN